MICDGRDGCFHGMYTACAQAYWSPAEFVKQPIACLTLASFLATNTGDVARKHIQDPELLSFIDVECYCWSTVLAGLTPMMNAGMVFCDRHYGGINYPKGGVGRIAQALAGGFLLPHGTVFSPCCMQLLFTWHGGQDACEYKASGGTVCVSRRGMRMS